MQTHLTMADDGRVTIPADLRAEIGMPRGGKLVVRVENGAVVLEPLEAAVRRVQTLVRQYVPEGVSLSEELLAERRAEAARE